jgi:hypothetical protein
MDQIYYSSDKSRRALTLHNKGLEKRLKEEVLPLAIFAEHKFGDSDLVRLQSAVWCGGEGSDNRPSHGEFLLEKGYVPPYAPVIKTRTKRGWAFSIPAEATSVVERVENERQRILAAAKRKEGKKYLPSTSLVIFFDDARPFQEEMDNVRLDSFVTSNILNLDLRFSTLYLVGRDVVFREYSLSGKVWLPSLTLENDSLRPSCIPRHHWHWVCGCHPWRSHPSMLQ